MTPGYLENMQAHVDEGGQLSHRNGVDLLKEVTNLRAELARAIEAMTPSHETKSAYMQQFRMPVPEGTLNVPWVTIKDIMKAISKRADVPAAAPASEWRPIETITEAEKYGGPDDTGSPWLLYDPQIATEHPDWYSDGISEGFWQDGEGWQCAIWDNDLDCWRTIVFEPTHYRAKPAAPAKEGE